jgi:hypothetical protein
MPGAFPYLGSAPKESVTSETQTGQPPTGGSPSGSESQTSRSFTGWWRCGWWWEGQRPDEGQGLPPGQRWCLDGSHAGPGVGGGDGFGGGPGGGCGAEKQNCCWCGNDKFHAGTMIGSSAPVAEASVCCCCSAMAAAASHSMDELAGQQRKAGKGLGLGLTPRAHTRPSSCCCSGAAALHVCHQSSHPGALAYGREKSAAV